MDNLNLPPELSIKYRIIRQLGEGANGITWLAVNQINGLLVAIKSLRLSMAEDFKSFELFRREAEVLSSIETPGVPKFYESVISDTAGAGCYIVQEYIDAPSLLDLLKKKKRLSEEETLQIMKAVADILIALHMNYAPPIIHRDIKPSNILCEWSGGLQRVWLIDFGAVANPQTKSGGSTIAGTYGYMAPEQMMGNCTIASDYYALGATALHLLTGIEPYKLSSDVFQLRFSDALDAHAPETSSQMRELLSVLLAPKEADRPHNTKELKSLILNVMAGFHPEVAKIDTKPSRFNILARMLNTYTNKSMTRNDNWITVPGLVRYVCVDAGGVGMCVDYTFVTIEGELMAGADNKLYIFDKDRKKLPIPCKVSYNPRNPMFNKLLSVESSKDDTIEPAESYITM